jgi:hypothetical protein
MPVTDLTRAVRLARIHTHYQTTAVTVKVKGRRTEGVVRPEAVTSESPPPVPIEL